MPPDWLTVAIGGVMLLATVVRSALGFGEALVAVPLLALLIPVDVAAPVAVLASITVAAAVLARDRSRVQLSSVGRLLVSSLAGIPFGLLLLTRVAESTVEAVLGVVILAFSGYALLARRGPSLEDDRAAWLFGLVAGVLGGAYGMNGPPLVVYGSLRGWSPREFRATLQGYFLPASTVVMAGYALAGLWTREVTRTYLLALPAVALGVLVGTLIHDRARASRFTRYVHVALLGVGTLLLARALAG
ncbi:MAG TPA: sulfite exporter TauE/SafE family protein [Longimicrobiales bacterium]|nr:sulfite exporter TauE/SafE family protein [Longimicrobiales bacterium]